MSQIFVATADHRKINEITSSCEKLITETQADLELFRHEQNQLRAQILEILEENNRLNTKLEVLKSATPTAAAADSKDDATREKLTKDALTNVKKQIDYLQAENHNLRTLNQSSQKTIQNLEYEIQNYRNQIFKPNSVGEVKQKYDTAIKLLESTIKTQKTEIIKQTQIIENLMEQKKQFRTHIDNLEAALKEKERELHSKADSNAVIEELQLKLQESMRQTKDLEKSLKLSKRVIEERFEREQCALQKVQEALAIAETAVADKEDAIKREQVVKEECENLASTIGQVMDEAARRVEKDMEALRNKFVENEKMLLETQEKLKEELQNQRKFNQILETRCHRFEKKYKEVAGENEKLVQQLQATAKALDDIHIKLEEKENLLKEEQHAIKDAEEHEREVQHYIQTTRQLKEKYKAAISDVTRKFETEIYRLQNENAYLKAENQVIKLQNYTSE